jgi:hypothetical protein
MAHSPMATLSPLWAITTLQTQKNPKKRARYLGVAMHKDEVLTKEECDALVGRTLPAHRHIWS